MLGCAFVVNQVDMLELCDLLFIVRKCIHKKVKRLNVILQSTISFLVNFSFKIQRHRDISQHQPFSLI